MQDGRTPDLWRGTGAGLSFYLETLMADTATVGEIVMIIPDAPEAPEAPEAPAMPEDLQASQRFKDECSEVKLSISPWIGGMTRTLKGDTKTEAAAAANVEADNFSATMRLYDPKNPYIKKANDLRNRISGFRDMMCLFVAGTWYIRNDRADAFYQRMEAFRSEAKTVEDEMNANRDSILDDSRRKLHDNFNHVDWPKSFRLNFNYIFRETSFPKALERLAPAAAAAEKARAFQQAKSTFDDAFASLMTETLSVLQPIIDKTGPVEKVFPPKGHKLHEWNGARVIERETHNMRPALIPEGGCRVKLSIKKTTEDVSQSSGWLLFSSTEEWQAMKPARDPSERLAMHETQIETLISRMAKLRMFGSVLADGTSIMSKLDEVEKLLRTGDAAQLSDELKRSSIARARFNSVLSEAKTAIEESITLRRTSRRRISRDINLDEL